MRKNLILIFVLSLVLLFSCSNPSSDSPAVPAAPADTTVTEIRSGIIDEGTLVKVEGLVVTSPVSLSGSSFCVQEPDVLSNGGIAIYIQDESGLSVSSGDELTITGIYQEFFGLSELVLTDVSGIDKTGTAVVPVPVFVDLDTLRDDASAESYESMLVTVEDVFVDSLDSDAGEFDIDVGTPDADPGVSVDDYFYRSNPFPIGMDSFSRISGCLLFLFDEFKIAPRSGDDLVWI